jgi:hypothetical protein
MNDSIPTQAAPAAPAASAEPETNVDAALDLRTKIGVTVILLLIGLFSLFVVADLVAYLFRWS